MKRLALSFVVISVLGLSSKTQAQNWPSFRGPNASGVAEGTKPPTTWDLEKAQNVLWKTPIPGLSHASPVVWGNNIFVITAISSDSTTGFQAKDRGIGLANDDVSHTWMIFALDKRNGQILWSIVKAGRQYELLAKNTMGQPLMATPALTQGMLILRGERAIYAIGER